MSEQDGWAPEEPEQRRTSGRFVQAKNWMEVSEGTGKSRRTFQRFKCRILGKALAGIVAWTADNKPARFKSEADIPEDFNWRLHSDGQHKGKKEFPKAFWAMPVWDYEVSEVRVWEVTQSGLKDALRSLAANPEWGSPLGYDVTVTREGKGLNTKYALSPSPKSAVPVEAAQAWNDAVAAGFDLERLFGGGDPFSGAAAAPDVPPAQESVPF